MKVCFSGVEHAIEIGSQWVSVFQVENTRLFARLCQSILSGKGEDATEPYTIWNDNGQPANPRSSFLCIANPFSLPWGDRRLLGGIYAKMERLMQEDEDFRRNIEGLEAELGAAISGLGFQMQGDYAFGGEWNLIAYLKAFSFDAEVPEDASLFDNLILFADYVADACFEGALLFVNLRVFLTEEELRSFYEHVFFLGIKVLMLESGSSGSVFYGERKLCIDQDLLESLLVCQPDCTPSAQGRICSNGFGAVTF